MFAAFCCNSTALSAYLCATFAGLTTLFAEPQASSPNLVQRQAESASLELAQDSQPAHPISASPTVGPLEEENCLPSPAAASSNVAKPQQSSKPVMPKGISSQGYSPSFETSTYRYLNYVTLSCDAAFPHQGQSELLLTSLTQDDSVPAAPAPDEIAQPEPDAEIQNGDFSDIASRNQQQQQKQRDSENAQQTQNAIAPHSPRAISSIRLADALNTTSDSGEPLQVPTESASSSANQHLVEHHFVPAPWHRSHPPRNTYRIRYQPLYFEDPNLERCDDDGGLLTEFKSIAHFGGRIPLLPYLMASDSPRECVNALPDCPSCHQFGPDAYLPKPTVKAIAAQAAATAGAAVGAVHVFP